MLEVDRVSLGSPETKALMHQPGLREDLSRRSVLPRPRVEPFTQPTKLILTPRHVAGKWVRPRVLSYKRFQGRRHLPVRSHGVLGVRVMRHLFLLLTALCLFLQPVTLPTVGPSGPRP